MDQDDVWRTRTKYVAFADMIATIILYASFFAAVVWLYFPELTQFVGDGADAVVRRADHELAAAVFWTMFVVLTGCSIMQMWAAYKLIDATKKNYDPFETFKITTVWRYFTIGFIVVQVVCALIVDKLLVHFMFTFVIRLCFLFVIWNFTTEMGLVLI